VRFLSFDDVVPTFAGRSVAIVGSAPTVLGNAHSFVDSHDVVVRVNNYRTSNAAGYRCDVFYSFFGGSIKKTREELIEDGVQLCMCKCPNSQPITSPWHEKNKKMMGVDFRYIYATRKPWWFCDTWIPSDEHFLHSFDLLGKHIPSTGFACILDVLKCKPQSVYLTGFDFFTSGLHNVNEKWKAGDPSDPIGHQPDLEREMVGMLMAGHPIHVDDALREMVKT